MAHYRGLVQSTSVPERFRPYVDATEEVARRFTAAGHTLYLVGGSVRDALFPGPAGPAGGAGGPPAGEPRPPPAAPAPPAPAPPRPARRGRRHPAPRRPALL